MRKLPLFFLVAILFTPITTFACDCMKLSEQDSLRQADVVFKGELIRVEKKDHETLSTLRVEKMIKGEDTNEAVITSLWSDCDFIFYTDITYIVYARRTEHGLIASACSGTKVLGESRRAELVQSIEDKTSKRRSVIFGVASIILLGLMIWFWPTQPNLK